MKLFSLASVVALANVFTLTAAHNEAVPAKSKNCYFVHIKADDTLNIEFQVGTRDAAASEQLDIDFYVLDPRKREAYSKKRVSDGDADIPLDMRGRYEFCFSNEYSGIDTKDVTFHVDHVWGSKLRTEKHDSLEGQLSFLDRIVKDVEHGNQYLKIRERTHRNTAESTNDRVKWWSIAQLVFVFANAVFQVVYLKRFFEVRSDV